MQQGVWKNEAINFFWNKNQYFQLFEMFIWRIKKLDNAHKNDYCVLFAYSSQNVCHNFNIQATAYVSRF